MEIRSTFLVVALALSASFSVAASDVASRTEIQETVRQAKIDLESRDAGKRLAAAQIIQGLGHHATSAVPNLIRCMSDPRPEVRSAAAYALESIGMAAKASAPILEKSLLDDSTDVRAAAAFAIGSIGYASKDAFPVLTRQAEDESPRLSLAASFAIHRVFPKNSNSSNNRRVAERVVPLFFKSLEQDTGYESIRLARAIGTVDPATGYSMVPRMMSLAESKKSPTVASNCSNSLQFLEEPLRVYAPDILRMAGGPSREDKIQGLKEIGWLKISNPSAIQIIRNALSSGSADVQVEAANALKHLGPVAQAAAPDLREAVRGGSEKLRVAASEALLTIKPDELDSLMPFLWNKDPKLANRLAMLRRLSEL